MRLGCALLEGLNRLAMSVEDKMVSAVGPSCHSSCGSCGSVVTLSRDEVVIYKCSCTLSSDSTRWLALKTISCILVVILFVRNYRHEIQDTTCHSRWRTSRPRCGGVCTLHGQYISQFFSCWFGTDG